MRSLGITRPTLDDPLYSQKNPHQTFLLIFSVVASLPLLEGHANSAALERELSDMTLFLWGVCLLGGSVIALIGEFWWGHTWNALVLERLGIGVVGVAALIYAGVVWFSAVAADDVAFAVSITAAYGASCLWRFGQITRRLRWIRTVTLEVRRHAGQEDGSTE